MEYLPVPSQVSLPRRLKLLMVATTTPGWGALPRLLAACKLFSVSLPTGGVLSATRRRFGEVQWRIETVVLHR